MTAAVAPFPPDQTLTPDQASELAAALDPVCANQVLFMFRGEGYEPGSFRKALYEAFAKADPTNFNLLNAVFPAEGLAFSVAAYVRGGIDIVRKAACRA